MISLPAMASCTRSLCIFLFGFEISHYVVSLRVSCLQLIFHCLMDSHVTETAEADRTKKQPAAKCYTHR